MIKILKYGDVPNSEIFARDEKISDVSGTVSEIIENVKQNGDDALRTYSEKFDGVLLSEIEVTEEEIKNAFELVENEFLEIIKEAKDNIYDYHKHQKRSSFIVNEKDGIVLGQKIIPIEKVGVYVPGGTAAYPSTVLMDIIPAKIAGCESICMVTPPSKDGLVNPYILTAAKIAGADRIFKVGGAQAIAALSYGTQSIPKVDKIVGPGNAYVAEAKRQVFGRVNIDMIAGPSEILVVADNTNNPVYVAADLLSQAEHDRMASAVLVCDDIDFARAVADELEKQLKALPRENIARASIENNGKIIVADNLMQAIDIANEIAPEHFELCVDNPFDYLDKIKHAGSVFLGKYSPEALGDYFSGPNHTLPTSGTAKFSSPLSVDDFVKKTQFSYYTRDALEKVKDKVAYFADKEGLHAHARSVLVRFEDNNNE